jgi:hypothetical protein
MDAMGRLKEALASASSAFVELDAHYARDRAPTTITRPPSGMPGADALLEFVDRKTAIPAPVEAGEVAKALLTAIAAVDMLEDAIETVKGSIPKR